MGDSMRWLIIFWTMLETSIGAVARIRSFIKATPREDNDAAELDPKETAINEGRVEIRKLCASHKEGSDIILKGVSLSLVPGEKVGICGRSGR